MNSNGTELEQVVHTHLTSCRSVWSRCFGALSIQQKFRFKISEIPRAQWNSTFRFHRAFGYCSCKQDTKERYWGQQFCYMERDISVRPAEITGPVKVDYLQSWSRIFWSDQTEMVRSILCTNRNFRNFGLNGKRPWSTKSQSSPLNINIRLSGF